MKRSYSRIGFSFMASHFLLTHHKVNGITLWPVASHGIQENKVTQTTVRSGDKAMIRLPPGMHGRLKERAKASYRTLNGEIVMLIEKGLAAEKTASEPGLDNQL